MIYQWRAVGSSVIPIAPHCVRLTETCVPHTGFHIAAPDRSGDRIGGVDRASEYRLWGGKT